MTQRNACRRVVCRRRFIAGSVAVSALGFPAVLRAQAKTVKVGFIHPVTGEMLGWVVPAQPELYPFPDGFY